MKITGIILLILGILSLFGGIVNPSGADTGVVIIGYIIKFSLVILGVVLINSNKQVVKPLVGKSPQKEEPKIGPPEEIRKLYQEENIDIYEKHITKQFSQEFTVDQANTIICIFESLLGSEIKAEFGNRNLIGWLKLDEIIQKKVDEVESKQGDNWADFIHGSFITYGYDYPGYDYGYPYGEYFVERDFNYILDEKKRFLES